MKNLFKINLLAVMLLSFPVLAVDGMAVIDMRTAVLSTQAAADAFKALEEDANYAANLEQAQSCLLYTSPSPRDQRGSRMPSSA